MLRIACIIKHLNINIEKIFGNLLKRDNLLHVESKNNIVIFDFDFILKPFMMDVSAE